MPTEPLALSTVRSAPLEEADYDAICDAMTATARGRWFLEEFSRRNRNCDTTEVLAAIARMEAAAVDNRAKQATQEVRIELLEMARTIAQARAGVAAGRGDAPPAPAAEPASLPATPDIAGAAERLRQIAWTVRACGIELPASEQIEQVAEAILSAGVLHTLGEQQTAMLTEVLHYLEHRVDRMLDSQLATAGSSGAATVPPRTKAHDIEPLVPPAPDFPLAMVDMTAANTNEAERGPLLRPPIVVHSAEEVPASTAISTTSSPVEPATPAVPQATIAPVMEVSQPSPVAAPPTQAPAPDTAPIAIELVAPAAPPAASAPQAIVPQAATPISAPMPAASEPAAAEAAATEAVANAPTLAVSLGDQAVARSAPDAIAAQVDDDLNELTDFAEFDAEPQRCRARATSRRMVGGGT